MTKKIVAAVAIALLFIASYRILRPQARLGMSDTNQVFPNSSAPTNTNLTNVIDYARHGISYRVAWFLADPKKLKLIPNYSKKRASQEMVDKEGCRGLTSAGFYDKNGTPMGLVISGGVMHHAYQLNALFNGVISITSDGTPEISAQEVGSPLALQAGPLLISGGEMLKLAIRDDEPSRRVVVGLTDTGKIIFLAFYLPESPYQGPLLTNVPEHLQEFEKSSGIKLTDALNLDGGSASVFYSNDIFLAELTSVGSFFCTR